MSVVGRFVIRLSIRWSLRRQLSYQRSTSKEALFFIERKIEFVEEKCPKLQWHRNRFKRIHRSTVAGAREAKCMPPYTLLGTPFQWVCATAGDRAVHWIRQKIARPSNLKASNSVKLGSFSLKFSRKPSLVLLYRYLKNQHQNLEKKFTLRSLTEVVSVFIFVQDLSKKQKFSHRNTSKS